MKKGKNLETLGTTGDAWGVIASLIQSPLFGNLSSCKSQHLSVLILTVPVMHQKYTADSSEVGADQTGNMLQHAIDLAFTHYYSILPQPDLHQVFPMERS